MAIDCLLLKLPGILYGPGLFVVPAAWSWELKRLINDRQKLEECFTLVLWIIELTSGWYMIEKEAETKAEHETFCREKNVNRFYNCLLPLTAFVIY